MLGWVLETGFEQVSGVLGTSDSYSYSYSNLVRPEFLTTEIDSKSLTVTLTARVRLRLKISQQDCDCDNKTARLQICRQLEQLEVEQCALRSKLGQRLGL